MTGPRPTTVVAVVGTGTDVGKTWVGAQLLRSWGRAGLAVAARKVAQSHEAGEAATDAAVLGAASGEPPEAVCPPALSFPVPMAPPMAAAVLGRRPPLLADLLGALRWPDRRVDVGLVETVGGLRSPQADDGDALDVLGALAPDRVVLVAAAGLGAVHAVRCAVDGLTAAGLAPAAVVLDRHDEDDDCHRRTVAWLVHRDRLPVVAVAGQPVTGAPGAARPSADGGPWLQASPDGALGALAASLVPTLR